MTTDTTTTPGAAQGAEQDSDRRFDRVEECFERIRERMRQAGDPLLLRDTDVAIDTIIDQFDAVATSRDALGEALRASEARADAAEAERNCLDQLVSHLRGIGQSNARDTQVYWDSVDTAYKAVYGDLDAAPGDTEGEAQP